MCLLASRAALVVATLFVFGACGGGDADKDTGSNPAACKLNSDCGHQERCDDATKTCVSVLPTGTACEADKDCVSGQVCNADTQLCEAAPCKSDCVSGEPDQCRTQGVVKCEKRSDGCFYWSKPTACSGTCYRGECLAKDACKDYTGLKGNAWKCTTKLHGTFDATVELITQGDKCYLQHRGMFYCPADESMKNKSKKFSCVSKMGEYTTTVNCVRPGG